MDTGLTTTEQREFIFSNELRIELSTAAYWSEKDLLALCCGVPPKDYGERDDVAPEAYRKEAKDKIGEALRSGALRTAKNPNAGTSEKLYGGVWQITPSHAVRWALGLFPKFPEWLASSQLKKIYEIQETEKKAAGRYTLKEAATLIAANGEAVEKFILKRFLNAVETGVLSTYMPGSKVINDISDYSRTNRLPNIHHEECYWDDLNSWISSHESRISFRFPCPEKALKANRKTRSAWDNDKLKKLLDRSREPGMTQAKLAKLEGVSRSRIGQLLNKAEARWGTKKNVSGISAFTRQSIK